MEGYAMCIESKLVEWNEDRNVEQMWEQRKQAMVDSAGDVCGSVRVGEKNPKNVCWNDVVKAAVERNEAAQNELVGAWDEV